MRCRAPRREGVLRPGVPLPLLAEIGLDVCNERIVLPLPRAVAEDAGFFIGEQDIPVLIDNVQPGLAHLPPGLLLARLLKEFVADIQLQDIALLQARVALCPLP